MRYPYHAIAGIAALSVARFGWLAIWLHFVQAASHEPFTRLLHAACFAVAILGLSLVSAVLFAIVTEWDNLRNSHCHALPHPSERTVYHNRVFPGLAGLGRETQNSL